MLAVISDKGTLHVFSLGMGNRASSLAGGVLDPLLPRYFLSQWGFARGKVRVEAREEELRLGWWGEGEGVVVVGREGGWWKFGVPREGLEGKESECREIGYKRYLNVGKEG
jgi:hypothetical protein